MELVITATTANGQEWDGDPATALEGLNMTFNVVDAEEVPTEVEGVLVGGTVGITVENNQGATLPETGGMGTTCSTSSAACWWWAPASCWWSASA